MLSSCPASSFDASLEQNVKIFDGNEVRIEDSVTTVTVRHHEQLSRLTEFSINSERSSQIFFLAYPSISCIKGWICITLSLLHQNNYIFRSRNVRFVSSLILWRRKVWGKMTSTCRQDVKKTSTHQKSSPWCLARESSYTPRVRRHFLDPVWFTEIPVGYARNDIIVVVFCMVVSGPDFELWIYIKAALLYISHDRDFFRSKCISNYSPPSRDTGTKIYGFYLTLKHKR